MPARPLMPETYYRMPWNLADNAITWLEPTTKCNMTCEGCYRENDPGGHRPLENVIEELEAIKRLRKTDGISIAGGEPLLYPHIVDLVRHVASQGWKPIIITNGSAMTPEIIRDLRKAGLIAFTVHVDSHQKRPGWPDRTEEELNDLRLKLATMIHEAGECQISAAFNATIYRDTLKNIPMLTRFAQQHQDLIHTMVYILFRTAKNLPHLESFVGGQTVDPCSLVYHLEHMQQHEDVTAQEVVDKMREADPSFEPCAFLNSNEDPRVTKWLISSSVGEKDKVLGYLDGKFSEFIQTSHHLLFGTYLAYTRPCLLNKAQILFPLSLLSRSLRKVFWKWLFNPSLWTKRLYLQNFTIIQPVDILEDGRISMCDGCPDSMFHGGRLIWKCRLDELNKFGGFIQCAPRR